MATAQAAANSAQGSSAWSAQWREWLVVAACLTLLALLIRGASLGNPVSEMDDQLYSFIGWRMLYGEWPFVDWWDRKPFGLFALFAMAHAVGGPQAIVYQLMALAFTVYGALLTYHLARPLADRAGAALAGVIYILLMAAFSGTSGQSEAFHVPMMLTAMWLVRDPERPDAVKRALIAMALCGVTLQVKYTVLPQCLFLGLWVLWGRYRAGESLVSILRLGSISVALGLLPTVLVGLFYLAIGGFEAFWFANFESFFLREGFQESRFYARQLLWLVPIGVLALGALYYAMRVAPPRDRTRYAFYAAWTVSVVATVVLPSTIYLFYLGALAPCVALLATPFYARSTIGGMAPAVILVMLFVHVLALPERYANEASARMDYAQFASTIAPHVDGEERCLYVFDGPVSLYRVTGGCAPSRMVYPDHLNNRLEMNAIGMSQTDEMARILAGKPGVIVNASRTVTPQNPASQALIKRVLAEDYEKLASMVNNRREIIAYVRKDRAGDAPSASDLSKADLNHSAR